MRWRAWCTEKRRKACGSCAGGQACDILEEPPRCTPDRGVEGTACGRYEGDSHDYFCAEGFRCDGGSMCLQAGELGACAP